MSNLTDTQSILLVQAAQRDDRSLYPLPATITAPKSALARSLASLVKRGLAEERETNVADQAARSEGDIRYGLFITDAGKAAIGVDGEGGKPDGASPGSAPVVAPEQAPRQTKAALVLALLQRERGATLAELVAATGWLPHTTRAALTGLRKKGHDVVKAKRDGVTCYSVTAAA